ncbi:MAG: hypothetical protein R2867_25000 [Caldilineaceae bacterium]
MSVIVAPLFCFGKGGATADISVQRSVHYLLFLSDLRQRSSVIVLVRFTHCIQEALRHGNLFCDYSLAQLWHISQDKHMRFCLTRENRGSVLGKRCEKTRAGEELQRGERIVSRKV